MKPIYKILVMFFLGGTAVIAQTDYNPEARIVELGIELPEPPQPVANYVSTVQVGNLLFLSGGGPLLPDGKYITGKLGRDLTVEQGYEAARIAGLGQLSKIKAALGSLNRVKRIARIQGMVNASSDFTQHSFVTNGISDLMGEIFGERGRHVRTSVGMGSLPFNIAVEVDMIVEVFPLEENESP
ncbi:MAG: RidA family protein [Flavobacteriaceae bacterium]|nr:RidA family protein [Flavobacteriaceae bacterium]